MRELSPAQIAWIDRARDADILAVAQRAPIAREYVGACPVCGGKDRFAVNPTKKGGVFFCRGFGGGDVIAMVEHVCSVTFLPACEIITAGRCRRRRRKSRPKILHGRPNSVSWIV
jgi:phage/plasmid primase-like uncharacterized protein